tara:strand:- start:246 stop:548 length:303 start_codon:yes stop_codon:yes gene_type:complete
MTKEYSPIIRETEIISAEDWTSLDKAEQDYGDSWRKRGGVGAYMMLARKWDRIENQVVEKGWDIFKSIEQDIRPEGILDDIKDLRRYLLLVEAHMRTKDK